MIITGYQGIGKSTLANKNHKIIDLESSCFWKEEDGIRSRPTDWYVYYCQMAQYLSKQGYIVFVSCHQEVRDWLSVHNEEKFCAIFPAKSIKEDWIQRLQNRYNVTQSKKDLKALEHAEKFYDSDINQLWYECQYNVEYYHNMAIIEDINYDLQALVDKL